MSILLNHSIDGVGISTAGVIKNATGEIIYPEHIMPGYIR